MTSRSRVRSRGFWSKGKRARRFANRRQSLYGRPETMIQEVWFIYGESRVQENRSRSLCLLQEVQWWELHSPFVCSMWMICLGQDAGSSKKLCSSPLTWRTEGQVSATGYANPSWQEGKEGEDQRSLEHGGMHLGLRLKLNRLKERIQVTSSVNSLPSFVGYYSTSLV